MRLPSWLLSTRYSMSSIMGIKASHDSLKLTPLEVSIFRLRQNSLNVRLPGSTELILLSSSSCINLVSEGLFSIAIEFIIIKRYWLIYSNAKFRVGILRFRSILVRIEPIFRRGECRWEGLFQRSAKMFTDLPNSPEEVLLIGNRLPSKTLRNKVLLPQSRSPRWGSTIFLISLLWLFFFSASILISVEDVSRHLSCLSILALVISSLRCVFVYSWR